MLLIIFMCLIAKIALVSGECNFGTQGMDNFDFNKVSGSWYVLLHSNNDNENNLDCFIFKFARPEGNFSFISVQAYVNSEKRHIITYGYASNWNTTGYVEFHHLQNKHTVNVLPKSAELSQGQSMWNGHGYFVTNEYDRYAIVKHCSLDLNKLFVYVGYRSKHPDETTVKDVLKDLKDNNIDISQLLISTTDHCQQEESSTEGIISA